MELDDAALVRASQQGDRDAFGLLISRHAQSILSLTTRMLGAAEAEDVAQDTFVAAYKALPTFKLDSKFNTSLYAEPDDSAVMLEAADHDTPLSQLEQAELAWALDQGIQALPLVYRESFVLRHVEGLDYDEMSAVLGVKRDTLKMRVYKARTLLCESLATLRERN